MSCHSFIVVTLERHLHSWRKSSIILVFIIVIFYSGLNLIHVWQQSTLTNTLSLITVLLFLFFSFLFYYNNTVWSVFKELIKNPQVWWLIMCISIYLSLNIRYPQENTHLLADVFWTLG